MSEITQCIISHMCEIQAQMAQSCDLTEHNKHKQHEPPAQVVNVRSGLLPPSPSWGKRMEFVLFLSVLLSNGLNGCVICVISRVAGSLVDKMCLYHLTCSQHVLPCAAAHVQCVCVGIVHVCLVPRFPRFALTSYSFAMFVAVRSCF